MHTVEFSSCNLKQLETASGCLGVQEYDTVVRAHVSELHAVALRLCQNPADARDLVQDTLERGLRHLDRYTPGTDARAWLMTILRRLFIDRCRVKAQHLKRDIPVDLVEERLCAAEQESLPRWASISLDELRAALSHLPETFRAIYQLHALEGCSYIEIAQKLGIPKATVGTRLNRARRRLRQLLEPQVPGAPDTDVWA
ncbi:RNA polymerase sigma-70 factor, ECF subfamily [Stigmatella erecta]|uniref:RNA polymerase sigma-70 factor, ECF subfamily n=1 Tax=Stigmatella erecta TaxID=83460 RepID=A0A1I0INR0_9BACT|nr:RNA polymerase sigma-70 factor, ECF subfamily [Stigmatella erecta]